MKDKKIMVSLPQKPWYGDKWCEIGFPSIWDVNVCAMPGQDKPNISREEIKNAFDNPIDTHRISDFARGKNEVAIIFDDLSRTTRSRGALLR